MRVTLFQALINYQPLTDIVGTRIFQASSLGNHRLDDSIDEQRRGVPVRPFVTYRMHTNFPVAGGIGHREYAQIWANDDPGDYMTIDEILRLCRLSVEGLPHSGDFLEARWVETGVDLADQAMGTINRYIRFQITGTLREREEVQ